MSTLNEIDGYVSGWAQPTRTSVDWIGRHRGMGRALLTFRRMFYGARHRRK